MIIGQHLINNIIYVLNIYIILYKYFYIILSTSKYLYVLNILNITNLKYLYVLNTFEYNQSKNIYIF